MHTTTVWTLYVYHCYQFRRTHSVPFLFTLGERLREQKLHEHKQTLLGTFDDSYSWRSTFLSNHHILRTELYTALNPGVSVNFSDSCCLFSSTQTLHVFPHSLSFFKRFFKRLEYLWTLCDISAVQPIGFGSWQVKENVWAIISLFCPAGVIRIHSRLLGWGISVVEKDGNTKS